MSQQNVVIFASGSADGGWSGAGRWVEASISWDIQARVSALVTNHLHWGVAKLAREHGIPLVITPNKELSRDDEEYIARYRKKFGDHSLRILEKFPKRKKNEKFSPQDLEIIEKIYAEIKREFTADYFILSGWLKYILNLPVDTTFNIHPGPTQEPYGWLHMHGDSVHQKVWELFEQGKIKKSCVTMHFVTPGIDEWPVIVQIPVDLEWCTKWKEVKKQVNDCEKDYQWKVTKLVLEGKITLDTHSGTVMVNISDIEQSQFPIGTVFWGYADITK